jgi:non-heme chloroperoxidase
MRRILTLIGLSLTLMAHAAGPATQTRNLAGTWQGTLKAGPQELRIVLKLAKADSGAWKGMLYSIDQGRDGAPVSSVIWDGSSLTLKVDAVRGTYEGKMSADGGSISGTWSQGPPLPLELQHATKQTAWPLDPSPHRIQLVTVDKDVKLEVLDWGGSGRPVVLLTGLGNDAHVFDRFAPKLTGSYHVYGITRRGFGDSSAPGSGYSADRLGDDVLSVLDALKINRPVLVGHSIGGEELSSVGSRHPEKVAGLVYLDAGYGYAYYDPARGNIDIDLAELQTKLAQLQAGKRPADPSALIQELLNMSLPGLSKDLRDLQEQINATPTVLRAAQSAASMSLPAQLIIAGEQRYSKIPVPILAIFADPHNLGPLPGVDPASRAAMEARDKTTTEAQVAAFESGIPSAHVVLIPHANHYVFLTNEADVLREMNAFIAGLPAPQ